MKRKIRVAINGFGRIGRYTTKLLFDKKNIELVAINDLANNEAILHLLKYDSIHGKFDREISLEKNYLVSGDQRIRLLDQAKPELLPWEEMDVDLVIECTGRFTSRESATLHLNAGAKKVLISAPAPDESIKMVVLGVNEEILTGEEKIISNASCTTNCLAPMVQILADNFGLVKGYASTVHSYTNDQNLHDAPHRDLRRARAAAYSIIPTTTNAGKALDRVLPDLKGKIEASAMRVPVPNGSLTDLIVELEREVSVEEINFAFEKASKNQFKGILQLESDPIVSMDIIGNPHSCIIDRELTSSKGTMVKLVGWYDNEAGYSNRLVDLIEYIFNQKS
jgi:glyceraldehyde 3-phosphate dehydrogenase